MNCNCFRIHLYKNKSFYNEIRPIYASYNYKLTLIQATNEKIFILESWIRDQRASMLICISLKRFARPL